MAGGEVEDGKPWRAHGRRRLPLSSSSREAAVVHHGHRQSRMAACRPRTRRTVSNSPKLIWKSTGDHDAAAVHNAPMLLSYLPSTPPLAEHLIDKPGRARWLDQLHSFWRTKTGDDLSAGRATLAVDWGSVRRTCKEWIKNPMNIALLLWLLCVGASGGMLVLLFLGLLDGAFPAPAARNRWIEVNNQLLNALFTLMSLYQHPALFHHLFLLCRWRPRDAAERAHLAVVVALLHLTVACQYVLCGLYWGYTRSTRPELDEDGFFVLGVVAPVAAVVYTVCSPLGKSDQCELACPDAARSATQTPIEHVAVVVEPEHILSQKFQDSEKFQL
ncbi:hypothetical protein ACP70R_021703 [Stipagrostis hirtigluma subsp. patula]